MELTASRYGTRRSRGAGPTCTTCRRSSGPARKEWAVPIAPRRSAWIGPNPVRPDLQRHSWQRAPLGYVELLSMRWLDPFHPESKFLHTCPRVWKRKKHSTDKTTKHVFCCSCPP